MVSASRRRFLSEVGAAGTAGLAGCLDAIPRFPKRIHNRDAIISPTTNGWRSKHGASTRQSVAIDPLPSAATAAVVVDLHDWWRGGPVFGPDQVVVPVQLPPEGESYEPSFEGLLALDTESGAEQWRVGYDKPFASPTVVGNTVFVQGATTYALDRSDGSVSWEYRSGYGYAGTAPVISGEVVAVIAARSRSIVGLNARTGEQLWSTPLVQKYPTGIASGTDGIYACVPGGDDGAGELVRIDPTSGTFEWRSKLHRRVSTPVVGPNRVYLWVGRQLVAFGKSNGERVWAASLRTSQHSYPNIAVDDGQCITLTQNAGQYPIVVALEATTGEELWRGPTVDNVEFNPLAITGTRVYVPTYDDSHQISALTRTDGTVVERWTLPGHPVTGVAVDNGRGTLITQTENSMSLTLVTE